MAPLKVGDSLPQGVKFEYVSLHPTKPMQVLAANSCSLQTFNSPRSQTDKMQVGSHHRR